MSDLPNTPDILRRIRSRREQRIAKEGPTLGTPVPRTRELPIVAFAADEFVIAEVKRKSPSAGEIAPGSDPVEQAARYYQAGIRHFSVLTEEDFFGGSIADLMAVKSAFPDCAVLRKDFILHAWDVDVAHRAGADAVLLIVALLKASEAGEIMRRARAFGLQVVVECHSAEEVAAAASLKPDIWGINSRDLRTFTTDILVPPALRPLLPKDSCCIFESGIWGYEHAFLAGSSGFNGVLVGEALMRSPDLAGEIQAGLHDGRQMVTTAHGAVTTASTARESSTALGNPAFWPLLAARREGLPAGRPLVKICGITRTEDARAAAELGADLLGFVFADSPRRAQSALLHELAAISTPGVLKVAVVTSAELEPELVELMENGLLDAVQLHGDFAPEDCLSICYPYFTALRVVDHATVEQCLQYHCPRVLLDAYAPGQAGGTGTVINSELVAAAAEQGPLWIAGGLKAENVAEIVRKHRPELIDASSGLESEPGRKDHGLLHRFFQEIHNATR